MQANKSVSAKYEVLDVVKLYSTLTLEHWETVLRRAVKTNNIDKLVSYRWGLQAGLALAAKKHLSTPQIDIWVLKRIKNVEDCMRFILKKKYPNPLDQVISKTDKGQRFDYIMDAKTAKKKRDSEFEYYLRKSNY